MRVLLKRASHFVVDSSNNRALAIHGISHLRVFGNVLFDIRGIEIDFALPTRPDSLCTGHAIFVEDGTETRNVIARNLVAVVRPVWSLLLVDQSPAAYWIVNPDNDVYENVAACSSQ